MPEQNVCGRCGQPLKSHESISVANVGLRCDRCFNEETAAMMGVDFDNTPLQPVTVSDADGVEHTFEFRSMLVPTGHALYARERVPEGQEGYEFSVLGDFDANVWDLFRVLYDRVQHGLAVRHVERGELGWRITDARHLVGRITWDPDRAREVPLVVIDGRPFTWDQVGRMLMSFEGFTLRAFVGDSIEVIGGPLLEKEEKAGILERPLTTAPTPSYDQRVEILRQPPRRRAAANHDAEVLIPVHNCRIRAGDKRQLAMGDGGLACRRARSVGRRSFGRRVVSGGGRTGGNPFGLILVWRR